MQSCDRLSFSDRRSPKVLLSYALLQIPCEGDIARLKHQGNLLNFTYI